MLAWFKDLVWSLRHPCPWPRSVVEGRLRPLQISVCPPARFPECVALHECNVPHGIPSDHRDTYESTLSSGRTLILLAEEAGRLVGTFGLAYHDAPNGRTLCLNYVLVCPDHHRRGVGTTLFVAALALLPKGHPDVLFTLSAVPTAKDFYSRFGVWWVGEHPYSDGQMHPVAVLPVTEATTHWCRTWLAEAGATLPATPYEIPIETHAEPAPTSDTESAPAPPPPPGPAATPATPASPQPRRLTLSLAVVAATSLPILADRSLADAAVATWAILADVLPWDFAAHPGLCGGFTLLVLTLAASRPRLSVAATTWFVINVLNSLWFANPS